MSNVQTTLLNEVIREDNSKKDNDNVESLDEFKEINIKDWKGEHKCPLCGFEWDD